jgi:hypothetical protein
MPSYSQLLSRVERRVRRLAGLRLGLLGLLVASGGALGVAVAHRVGWLPLDPLDVGLLLGLPVACAAILYAIGRRTGVLLPRVLLRLDGALQTGERLSALYELYQRGDRGPFRDRLERKVRDVARTWKSGLPVGGVRIAQMVTGLAALAACVPLALTAPAPTPPPIEAPARENPAGARIARPADPSTAARLDSDQPAVDRDATPSSGEPRSLSLDDPLSGLWRTPDAPAVLEEDRPGEIPGTSGPTQAQMAEDLLRQIEERLRQEGGGLTSEERRALQNLARQLGSDSALGQALADILSQEEGSDLTDPLAQARDLAQEPDTSAPPEEPQDTVSGQTADAGQGNPDQGPAWAARPPEQSETDQKATGPEEADPGLAPRDDEGPSPGNAQAYDEDRFGGVEGAPGEGAAMPETPGFLPIDLSAPFGPSGPLREFMTKGVPLEAAPAGETDGAKLTVDYEALRALLDVRPLPPETQDLVRLYFQAITQGGR